MHEYLLYSQIPASRHDQVLNILAGVTAAQPVKLCEQHLVYQQLAHAEVARSRKTTTKPASEPDRLNYYKLVRDIHGGREDGGVASAWKLRMEAVPDAGVSAFIARAVSETVLDDGELDKFRGRPTLYKYVNQYLADTDRFVNGNIIIRVARILLVPEGTGALEPLDAPIIDLTDCNPLDPSGTYLVEACIRVENGSNNALVEQATKELLAFKNALDGSIDFRVPDRFALDTRVPKGA